MENIEIKKYLKNILDFLLEPISATHAYMISNKPNKYSKFTILFMIISIMLVSHWIIKALFIDFFVGAISFIIIYIPICAAIYFRKHFLRFAKINKDLSFEVENLREDNIIKSEYIEFQNKRLNEIYNLLINKRDINIDDIKYAFEDLETIKAKAKINAKLDSRIVKSYLYVIWGLMFNYKIDLNHHKTVSTLQEYTESVGDGISRDTIEVMIADIKKLFGLTITI